jgi:hypothetical protein
LAACRTPGRSSFYDVRNVRDKQLNVVADTNAAEKIRSRGVMKA